MDPQDALLVVEVYHRRGRNRALQPAPIDCLKRVFKDLFLCFYFPQASGVPWGTQPLLYRVAITRQAATRDTATATKEEDGSQLRIMHKGDYERSKRIDIQAREHQTCLLPGAAGVGEMVLVPLFVNVDPTLSRFHIDFIIDDEVAYRIDSIVTSANSPSRVKILTGEPTRLLILRNPNSGSFSTIVEPWNTH